MTGADFNDLENGSVGRGPCGRALRSLKAFPWKSWDKVVEKAKEGKKLAKDDPRRIVHMLKVGSALTLVCLFYYSRPFSLGVDAMWSILTVALVFEYTVGATLERSLNRLVATLPAGVLAVGVHHISTLWGGVGEPIVVAFFVFVLAGIASFLRFYPKLKARHDYGFQVFILTFSLLSVSGYRDEEVLDMAHRRLSTVAIGTCTTIMINICICPVWVGVDFQNLIVGNMDKLGDFLEGFGSEYFDIKENGLSSTDSKSSLQQYKTVLTTKTIEENMSNLSRWEPGHGRFKFFHPWEKYLNVGTQTRQCAYKIEALNTYMNHEIQAPVEIRMKIQEECTNICTESGKALKELAALVKKMTKSSSPDNHIACSKAAAESLDSLLKSGIWDDVYNVLETIPAASVALLLIEVVTCVENIAEAVHELASAADFKTEKPKLIQQSVLSEESHVTITIDHISTEGRSEYRSLDGTITD